MSENPSYMVHWKARVIISDRTMHEGLITQVRKGGFGMEFTQAVSTGSTLSVEFHVKHDGQLRRLRAKTKVTYCMVKSQSIGASLKLATIKMSKQDNHTMNNILQVLGNSDEFNLQA